MSKYIIGIDLGTTNSAVSYLQTEDAEATPQLLSITQVSNMGETDEFETLPSFMYLPDKEDYKAGSLNVPWSSKDRDFCIGALARKNAASQPAKTVASAKSWLCAANVDRSLAILPWNRDDPDRKLSPVEAARRYLEHVRDVWNYAIAKRDKESKFQEQEIVLTVPASFDAVARELTAKAADAAGLNVTLIEEPQAAFYAWLQDHGETWREVITPGELVLVCDVGGGTTDFSLIEVTDVEGDLELQRVAVGNHILLGGDNMDLTLAHAVAEKFKKEKKLQLDPYQIAGLTHASREAKEALCTDPSLKPQKLTVLGRGSGVIGGTITSDLSYDELEELLLGGFFPKCELTDQPQQDRRGGLRAFGLNYETDPAITKHLAAFLLRHCPKDDAGSPVLPSAVLFNGGVTKAPLLKQRIVDALNHWRQDDKNPVTEILGANPDLAVAMGAAWYGHVRRGHAIRIKAGSSHSYYVGIESSMPAVPGHSPPMEALCVVQFGMEEGTVNEIPHVGLGLLVGETTEFRFLTATDRKDDAPGTVLPDIESAGLTELPLLTTQLPAEGDKTSAGTLVPVDLRANLSEIGTLQVWCVEENGERQWKLEYELRAVHAEDDADGDAETAEV